MGGPGRPPRLGPLSRHRTTVREPAMKVSAGQRSRRSWKEPALCSRGNEGRGSQNSRASIICYLGLPPGERACPMSGFLNLSTTDILGGVNLCFGGCPVHWNLFSSIADLYPLDISTTCPLVTTKIPLIGTSLGLCFFALILCRCSQP